MSLDTMKAENPPLLRRHGFDLGADPIEQQLRIRGGFRRRLIGDGLPTLDM